MLQRVGHYQQVVYVGLDEAPFGLSGRTQTVPLGPEQGLQEERVQQGAFGVALPDAAKHVDGLCQPVRGDDAQLQQFRTAIQIRQSRSAADAREIACSITVALSCRGCVFNQTWS